MQFLRNTLVLLTVFSLIFTGLPYHINSFTGEHAFPSPFSLSGTGGSSFSITGNMTVGANSDMVFENTQIEVVTDYAVWVMVYGSLELVNSSISALHPGASLNIELIQNGTSETQSLIMNNTTIRIAGSIISRNTTLFIGNSSIYGSGNVSSAAESFRIEMYNSTAFLHNSLLSGLYRTGNVTEHVAGFANYTAGSPVSNQGYIPLSTSPELPGNTIINRISANLQFSGNNPQDKNKLNFSAGGNMIYRYILNQTGSAYVKENTTFSFNTSAFGYNVSEFMSSFRVFFNDSYASGSNSTVWKLNLTMYSDDIVHITGCSYFDYMFRNSSLVLANSIIGLNQEPFYSGRNQPNPDKNAMLLSGNSSLYFITSNLSSEGGHALPFMLRGRSQFYAYQEIIPEPTSKGVPVKNYSYRASPFILDPALEKQYNNSVSGLRHMLDNFSIMERKFLLQRISNDTLLTQAIITQSQNYSALNYNITVDGRKSGFTPGPFPHYSQSEMQVPIQVRIPEISAYIYPLTVFGNTTNKVEFSVNATLFTSGTVYWNLTYTSALRKISSSGVLIGIIAGMSTTRTCELITGYLDRVNSASISLSLYCPNYTVSGRYINVSVQVKQYTSAFLSLSTTCSWQSGGTIDLNISVSNVGNQYLNGTGIIVRFFNSGNVERKAQFTENIGALKIENYSMTFAGLSYNTSVVVTRLVPSARYMLAPNVSLVSTLNFSPDRQFTVLVQEKGLANGTDWSFVISGKEYNSSLFSTPVDLVNGTYNITILPVPGYSRISRYVDLTVNGRSTSCTAFFSIFRFSVSINETGIPSGTQWFATLNGVKYTFRSEIGTIMLPNGTYDLNFTATGKYMPVNATVTIQGRNVSMIVHFNPVNNSFLHSLERTLSYYRYLLAAILVIMFVFIYRTFHDSVKICSKCFTTYHGFGKCPVCGSKVLKGESEDRK